MSIKKNQLNYIFLSIVFAVSSCTPKVAKYQIPPSKTIKVTTNKNVELFGLMVQLDNGKGLEANNDSAIIENKKMAWKDFYSLTVINYARFKAFENDTALNFYRRLAQSGISDDYIIGFLLQCDEVPGSKINATTDKGIIAGFPKNGDSIEANNTAETFLKLLNEFYKKINFENYLQENKNNYATIISEVEKNVPANLVPVMESFYQKQFSAYYLVPSLNLFPTTGFGKMNSSTNTIYNVLGALGVQSFKSTPPVLAFDYPDKILGLTVHEFGHSFVNPAIDKVPKEIIEKTKYLYAPIKDAMSSKGYIYWISCLYEHFVRAGEVLIARQLGQNDRAKKILEDNVKEKFLYLPQIVQQLEIYDRNKKNYKSYDHYIVQVVEKLKPVEN